MATHLNLGKCKLIPTGHGHLITSRGLLAAKTFIHLTGRLKCALCDRRSKQEGHPVGADLTLQLPRVVAISLQDASLQDHEQLLRIYKRQPNPIQLEDEASVHGGEHQWGVQGMRSGRVGTHWVLWRPWRTFPAANQDPKEG